MCFKVLGNESIMIQQPKESSSDSCLSPMTPLICLEEITCNQVGKQTANKNNGNGTEVLYV